MELRPWPFAFCAVEGSHFLPHLRLIMTDAEAGSGSGFWSSVQLMKSFKSTGSNVDQNF